MTQKQGERAAPPPQVSPNKATAAKTTLSPPSSQGVGQNAGCAEDEMITRYEDREYADLLMVERAMQMGAYPIEEGR